MAIVFNPFLKRGATMSIGISEMDSDLWAYLNGESTVLSSYDIQRIDCGMPQHTTEIFLPNCNYIGESAFESCQNLQSVYLPPIVRIGAFAFYSAFTSSAEISLSARNIGGEAFTGANLAVLDVYCEQAIDTAFGCDCPNLRTLTITVPALGGYAFARCSNLQTVYCTCDEIQYNPFVSDYALTSLYLLSSRVTTPNNFYLGRSFPTTIYVPSELYDSYITAQGWSEMSSRIQPIQEVIPE